MLVGISSIEFDALGHVVIDATYESAQGGERRRRMTRIATLDGGAVFNDFGFTDADRTIDLEWPPTSAVNDARIMRLAAVYGFCTLALPDGCYEAGIESYTPGTSANRLRLLIKRKISE